MKVEFDKQGAQDRLRKAVYYLIGERVVDNDKDIAAAMNANDNTVWQATSGNEKYLTLNFLKRFCVAYPNIDFDWLKDGEGEMLKVQSINNSGTINAPSGVVGQVHGDFHSNGGKDRLIDEQKQEVDKMFEAIIVAVNGFQRSNERHDEYVVRQDDYIKRQDEYIARIINNSYLRNETNMKRFDLLLEQINKLILMVVEQNQRTQDRADKLVEMLEKKI